MSFAAALLSNMSRARAQGLGPVSYHSGNAGTEGAVWPLPCPEKTQRLGVFRLFRDYCTARVSISAYQTQYGVMSFGRESVTTRSVELT